MKEFKTGQLAMWNDGVDYYIVKVLLRSDDLIEERTPVKILSVARSVHSADFLLGGELIVPTSNLLSTRASFLYIFSEESW